MGAGFSGLVAGEQLSKSGFRCKIIDKRDHIGGNAYDKFDEAGVLIHPYGPHYFRTNSQRIIEYLSQFTEWSEVAYEIRSFTKNQYWHFPINLNTFEQWLGRESTEEEWSQWLDEHKVPMTSPANSEEVILSQVGWDLYKAFFEQYTLKQWKKHPKELAASVCGRIPIRTNRDNRYLTEEFQALPLDGYTKMMERIIDSSQGLEVELGVDYLADRNRWDSKHIIYTGPIDAFYDYSFGPLPYRSLRFDYESYNQEQLQTREAESGKPGHWQPVLQVNYPDLDVPYTRTVEIKHATKQDIPASTVVREYPEEWTPEKEPFYPVPTQESAELYQKYKELADRDEHVSFIGRLGCYRYYNMDQVVGMALTESQKLIKKYTRI